MSLKILHFNDVYRCAPQKLAPNSSDTIDVTQFGALLDSLRAQWNELPDGKRDGAFKWATYSTCLTLAFRPSVVFWRRILSLSRKFGDARQPHGDSDSKLFAMDFHLVGSRDERTESRCLAGRLVTSQNRISEHLQHYRS
jgi:hypothetical protein